MSGHSIVTGFQKTSDGTPTQAQLDDDLNLKVAGVLAIDYGDGVPVKSGTPNSPVFTDTVGTLTVLIDYAGGASPVYIGKAFPGTLTSASIGWQIKKLSYDGSGNLTSIRFAGGNSTQTWKWDDRATYTYDT